MNLLNHLNNSAYMNNIIKILNNVFFFSFTNISLVSDKTKE